MFQAVFPFARKFFSGFSSNELVEVQHGWMIHVQEFLRKVLVAFLYAEASSNLIYAHNNNISNVIPRVGFGNAIMFTDLTAAFVGINRGCLMILFIYAHAPRKFMLLQTWR